MRCEGYRPVCGTDELAVGVEAVAGGVRLHGDGLVEQGEADAGRGASEATR